MCYKKLKKAIAGVLVLTLCLTTGTTAVVRASNASSEVPSTEVTSDDGGTAPEGTPPDGTAPEGTPPDGAPSGGGANTMTYDYTGALSGALTADGETIVSDKESAAAATADQNAALVQNAGTLTITNGTLTKSGDDSNGDNCNFYGINSILLAVNSGSTSYISGSSLSADSEGSNGIFSTDGATVYANDNTITTTAGNSRGLDATYGGTIVADKMTISTQGDHSGAIATDRGGGYISVANSTLSTAGSGSPLLYSTGDIEVDNVTGTATGSQIAGMEGLNTILIYNSSLTSTLTNATASDPMADGIIIYQSTSGDAESTTGETATFEASNSTLKSAITSGTMFYFTNTKANVVLSDTTLDFDSSKADLITVQGNDSNNWGTAGSNGADVTFTGLGETLNGNVEVDTISSLNLYLLNETTYTGAMEISTNEVNTDISAAPITVNIDSTSKWVVTGNSTVTDLNAESGASIVDDQGNTVSIVVNGETVVSGDSAYTITVTNSYTSTVETDSNNALSTFYIDRTSFDAYYGLETTFSTNGIATVEATSNTEDSSSGETTSQDETENNHFVYYGILIAAVVLGGIGIITYRQLKSKKHSANKK